MTMLSRNGIRQPQTLELVAGNRAEHQHRQVRQQQPRRPAELRPRGDEAAMLVRARPFHRQQHRTAPFATDSDPLDKADDRQDDGAPDADRLVTRDKTDRKGRKPRDQEGCDQRRLAADAVAVMAEDCRADWPGDEANCINGKGLQHPDQWVGLGKEELAEDQTGDDAVEQEVVPLDRRADGAGDYGPPQLSAVIGLGNSAPEEFGRRHPILQPGRSPP
jgi:hypothetical protein